MRGFIFHYTTYPWGHGINIMEKYGFGFCRIYWYNDDETTVYLDFLSVSECDRHKGLGTCMQELREEIGRILRATESCLWVVKGSWMHEWYQRRGYVDFIDHKTEENAIWMKKKL